MTLCACGCGFPVTVLGDRRPRRFFSMSCRSRAHAQRMSPAARQARARKAGLARALKARKGMTQAWSASSRFL